MDGEEPSFRPQELPQTHITSAKRSYAQVDVDNEWPSASGSSVRETRGIAGGSDGEESDRHKRARSESDTSSDESLDAFSSSSSSSSSSSRESGSAGSSGSSNNDSYESSSGSSRFIIDALLIPDDDLPDLPMPLVSPTPPSMTRRRDPSPPVPSRYPGSDNQINRNGEAESTQGWPRHSLGTRRSPFPIGPPSPSALFPVHWPASVSSRSANNRSRLSRYHPGETTTSLDPTDFSQPNIAQDLQHGARQPSVAEHPLRTAGTPNSDILPARPSWSTGHSSPPLRRRSTVASRTHRFSDELYRLAPLPTLEPISPLLRSLDQGSGDDATTSERPPRARQNSELSIATQSDGPPRSSRPLYSRRLDALREGGSRPTGPRFPNNDRPRTSDDGLQSNVDRMFADIQSISERLVATRENMSYFLYGRRSPPERTGDTRLRRVGESRQTNTGTRQPVPTLYNAPSDSEGEMNSMSEGRSTTDGSLRTYDPWSTDSISRPRDLPEALEGDNSDDRHGAASRFRLRAVSSRSFLNDELDNSTRLPPRLMPRTASHLNRSPSQLESRDMDSYLLRRLEGTLDEDSSWFSALDSPRAYPYGQSSPDRGYQGDSTLGPSLRRLTTARPDPPLGPRSRWDGTGSPRDFSRRTSSSSTTTDSFDGNLSTPSEDPWRVLAEERRRPFNDIPSTFTIPMPPWRDGAWDGPEDLRSHRHDPPPLNLHPNSRTPSVQDEETASYLSLPYTYTAQENPNAYLRRMRQSHIPPAFRRPAPTPMTLPPLSGTTSNRSLPSISTLPERGGALMDEIDSADTLGMNARPAVPGRQSSLGSSVSGSSPSPPSAALVGGRSHSGIDLSAYHHGPFRASLQRSVELGHLRSMSQSAIHTTDPAPPPQSSDVRHTTRSNRSINQSLLSTFRSGDTSSLGRLHPPRRWEPVDVDTILSQPSNRATLSQGSHSELRSSRVEGPRSRIMTRPFGDSPERRPQGPFNFAMHRSASSRRDTDRSSTEWLGMSAPDSLDDLWTELPDLPDMMDVDIPEHPNDDLQHALQALRSDGPNNRDTSRLHGAEQRSRLFGPDDHMSGESAVLRNNLELLRGGRPPRGSTARPTDLVNVPPRRATNHRSQSRSPSRDTSETARSQSHFERYARLRAMRARIRGQSGPEEVRSRAELPLHTFLTSRYRARRNLGDYMRDEDFDPSYETLLALASSIGDALPRSTPEHLITSMPTGFYKDWADAESDSRCPICLDDYKTLDPVLKMHDCRHWLHKECLEKWLRSATSCPVCRQQVRMRERSPSPPVAAGPSMQNPRSRDEDDSDIDEDDAWRNDLEWLMLPPQQPRPRSRH